MSTHSNIGFRFVELPDSSIQNPLVSVICLTYKHEYFIDKALEGFLMQKTSFDFEILIFDDCSPDNTEEIVMRYMHEVPHGHRIKYYRQNENIGVNQNGLFALRTCTGEFVALCEGDDFWVDPCKLQKQVDFLKDKPEFNACFHNVKIYSEDLGNSQGLVYSNERQSEISLVDLVNGDYMHTCSLVFRNLHGFFYPFLYNQVPLDDDSIGYCLLFNGRKAYYIDEVMAVYRKHIGGTWSLLSQEKRLKWTIKNLQASINYYKDDILYPSLKKRLKTSSIVLMKMAIRKVDPILFLKGLKIFVFG